MPPPGRALLDEHVDRLAAALPALRAAGDTLARWGSTLAHRLTGGNQLLVEQRTTGRRHLVTHCPPPTARATGACAHRTSR